MCAARGRQCTSYARMTLAKSLKGKPSRYNSPLSPLPILVALFPRDGLIFQSLRRAFRRHILRSSPLSVIALSLQRGYLARCSPYRMRFVHSIRYISYLGHQNRTVLASDSSLAFSLFIFDATPHLTLCANGINDFPRLLWKRQARLAWWAGSIQGCQV